MGLELYTGIVMIKRRDDLVKAISVKTRFRHWGSPIRVLKTTLCQKHC